MKNLFLSFSIISLCFTACNSNHYKASHILKNMPQPDYSYIVQPEFKGSKESLENELKNVYKSTGVKVDAVGFHSYDPRTKTQIDHIYHLQVEVVNCKTLSEMNNETKTNELALDIAKYVTTHITNSEKYADIEISFIEDTDGNRNSNRQNVFYKLPNFEPTKLYK